MSTLNRIIVETNSGFYILGIDLDNFQIYFFSFTTLSGNLLNNNYYRSIKISGDSIVINEITVQTNTTNIQKLTEYNFINPYNLTFIHEIMVPTNYFNFTLPIISSSAILSNLVYYIASNSSFDSTDNSLIIIVYRLGTLMVSSIYQIIPFSNNIYSPNTLLLSAASLSNSQEIVILYDTLKNTTSSWIINLFPVMKIQTTADLNPFK